MTYQMETLIFRFLGKGKRKTWMEEDGESEGHSEVGVSARQSPWPPDRFNAVSSVNWVFEMM